MSNWITGRTPYLTLAAAVVVLLGLMVLNAALAASTSGSAAPPGVLAPIGADVLPSGQADGRGDA